MIKYLFLCFLIAFAACQKEVSQEKQCGIVVSRSLHFVTVQYPSGEKKPVTDMSLIIGQKYCK